MTTHPDRNAAAVPERALPVVGIVLAAGAGSRMGTPKALLRNDRGVPWVELASSVLSRAGCSEVIVVLGAAEAEARALVPLGASVAVAEEWATGMSASLRCGLERAQQTDAVAAAITLVDLPDLPVAAAERVFAGGIGLSTLRRAAFDGAPGHPVLVGRDHWEPLLAALSGDTGANRYLENAGVDLVECADLGSGNDRDYPATTRRDAPRSAWSVMVAWLRERPVGLHLALMLTLTFSTGLIDAVGYLGLDRVFTGNMTGNVVILAMGLTGADELPIIGPLLALAGFMVGATIAGRVLRVVDDGWSTRSTVLFGLVGLILLATATVVFVVGGPGPKWLALSVTTSLGLAMGIQAGVARHIAVKDVTTVVVTSTLVGLAYDSRLGGHATQPWKRRAGAIVLIAAGAGAGALLLRVDLSAGIAVAAGITLLVALLGHLGAPGRERAAEAIAAQ